MRVMVIVPASEASEANKMPGEKFFAAMHAFNEELVAAGVMLSGEGLTPSARGKRVRFAGGTTTVHDGPFTESKEMVAGFWIWKVASMDEAVAWVRRIPVPDRDDPAHVEGAQIEIRPIAEVEDLGDSFTPELQAKEQQLRDELARR